MTQKQLKKALESAGKWFFLTQCETIKAWKGDKNVLINDLFKEGFDADISGTKTRVNASLRIIDAGCEKDALDMIKNSEKVNKKHPGADLLAEYILKRI